VRGLAEFERMADQVVLDRDEFARHLFGPEPAASVIIAEADGAVAGMALWFRTFSTFLGRPGIWLEDLYVRPSARGRGVGGALLRHLRTLTDGRVEWNVLDWNTGAIAVYDAIGAIPDAEGWVAYRWEPAAGASEQTSAR
jgi:GNAT superfamily N-acetyltransferase